MIKSRIAASLLTLCAIVSMAPAAFAAGGGDTSATVTAGSLTLTGAVPANFAGRNITNAAQTTTANLDVFSASDLRGTGAGWAVSAQATQFTTGIGGHNLAHDSLFMSSPDVTANGTTSPAPTINPNLGITSLDNTNAAIVAAAGTDEGMGQYDFSATTLTLHLPADVYAGQYNSTVTVSAISAP